MPPLFNLLCSFRKWRLFAFCPPLKHLLHSSPSPSSLRQQKPSLCALGSLPLPCCPQLDGQAWVLSLAPSYEQAGDVTCFQPFSDNGKRWWLDCGELTLTCEELTVQVQLPGQGPQTPWVLDYNIVQASPRYYFANMKDNLCFFIRVPFHAHTVLLIQNISMTVSKAPWSCFNKLLSPCASCGLAPLISLFLQPASREINISESHSRRYIFPSLEEEASWLRIYSSSPIGMGTWEVLLAQGPITHRMWWSL